MITVHTWGDSDSWCSPPKKSIVQQQSFCVTSLSFLSTRLPSSHYRIFALTNIQFHVLFYVSEYPLTLCGFQADYDATVMWHYDVTVVCRAPAICLLKFHILCQVFVTWFLNRFFLLCAGYPWFQKGQKTSSKASRRSSTEGHHSGGKKNHCSPARTWWSQESLCRGGKWKKSEISS